MVCVCFPSCVSPWKHTTLTWKFVWDYFVNDFLYSIFLVLSFSISYFVNNETSWMNPLFFTFSLSHHFWGFCSTFWQRRQWQPTRILLPGKSHGWRSLVGCSTWGHEESDMTERFHFHFSLSCIGEGKGNLLQCSCLENPRDWGAWWAAVYGVAQSRTRLKRLSSSSSSSTFWKSSSVLPFNLWNFYYHASECLKLLFLQKFLFYIIQLLNQGWNIFSCIAEDTNHPWWFL